MTLLSTILLHGLAGNPQRFTPEFIFGNSVSAVVAQQPGDLSVTIGTVLMVTYCAVALIVGAAVLDQRDA